MIELRSIGKRFGGVTALDAVSLEVPRGARLALFGPSGSGKTTILRLIAGLDLPDQGEILLDGKSASSPRSAIDPVDRGVGLVFQTPALWPHMTVAQNVAFGLHALDRAALTSRLDTVLAWTSLTAFRDRYPHELSGGQAQRVALARALAPEPRYLLFDEPLAHVDEDARDELLALIREAVEQTNATLVYVTHDREEVATMCSTCCRLRGGRVVSVGDVEGGT